MLAIIVKKVKVESREQSYSLKVYLRILGYQNDWF